MSGTRKTYDNEFKISAVKLVLDTGKSVESVANDLGISSNSLFNWKKQYLEDAKNSFPGKGHLNPSDEEIRKYYHLSKNRYGFLRIYNTPL
jgi:transposase